MRWKSNQEMTPMYIQYTYYFSIEFGKTIFNSLFYLLECQENG